MSLRLHAINFWLRLLVKPKLARMKSPQKARALFERDAARLFPIPADANFLEDTIRGAGDVTIPALWASRGRPDRRKVILYLHGGAYLAGSSRTHRHLAAALAGAAGTRALVPDYRLAPEHPFPAAVEDAVAAYRHLLDAGYDRKAALDVLTGLAAKLISNFTNALAHTRLDRGMEKYAWVHPDDR